MKTLTLILLFQLFTIESYGQSLKPKLIGIVVNDLDKATLWYEKVLDLKLFKELSFPKYDSLKINFLRGEEFQLELMEKKTSFSINKYVENYSINDKPMLGFSKIAFSVSDASKLYERLKKLEVSVILGLTNDEEFNTVYFIIKDLDGNVLQFIEQK